MTSTMQTQEQSQPPIESNLPADLERRVIDLLRQIYDPEIPVSIFDLGLIYAIEQTAPTELRIRMTLTAPACPVAGSLPGQVASVIESLDEIDRCEVQLQWDPPWTDERMTEDARLTLGLY